jgi:FMN-dependent NADH-azoreductase
MANVLILNGSPRGNRSHSRRLVNLLVEKWQNNHPNDSFKFREIGKANIPHINENWIAAAFTPPQERSPEMTASLAISDQLVDELWWADVIIAGVPMYNWSVPSSFKAYIDQVMRIGRTWTFASGVPDGVYKGLLLNKKMYLISARGDFGYEAGGHNEKMNFQSSYLKTVFGIMGIRDIEEVILENEEFGGEKFINSIQKAELQIENLLKQSLIKNQIEVCC